MMAAGPLRLPDPAREMNGQIAAGRCWRTCRLRAARWRLGRTSCSAAGFLRARLVYIEEPVASSASDTGKDMAGGFADYRSAIDRQPTTETKAHHSQPVPYAFDPSCVSLS